MKHFSTRKQLLLSVLSLLACVSMLVGSTFAWFTDSVTSASNKIQAGTLQIDLEVLDNGAWTSIKDSKAPLFDYDLWEPGYTAVQILKVKNEGTLALKWLAKFQSAQELSILANVIDVYVCPSATALSKPGRDLAGYTKVGTVAEFVNTIEETTYGTLEAGAEAYLGIALKMQESAGNEYQGLDLGGAFDIMIVATQYTYEDDSFNNQYDKDATYDVHTAEGALNGDTAINLEVRDEAGYKVASALVPAGAVADEGVRIIVDDNAPYGNITLAAGKEAKGFDVKVLGLKESNTEMIKVELRIPAGLDPATVELYHKDVKIDSSYNPNTGYVTFETATFSPFTVVYDAESEYEAPEADTNNLPKATVTEFTETDGIKWGNYGQWSPTEGKEAKLDVAYKFTSPAELDPAYANWYCDYVVSLDRALGANEIFLGGNYGSFGWIGFHNGDLTLEANEEIALLESVTTNPWTYADIYNFVGEFICGVGNVGDSLQGATFKVCLRLTNPETGVSYDVNTITYTW